ncbi:MAG TPA: hypothetical protein VHG52_08195, partial [Thermomicrobiales bacterium]|nr:hypothetical protein [Thermomicrobiales bacterium]
MTTTRLAALILVLPWLLMVVTPTIHAQAPADQASEEPIPLLDIARVVPYPADFGDLVPGIGVVDGQFVTLDEDARRAATAAAAGEDSTATMQGANRGLAEASWLQRYESQLAAPSPDDPDRFSVEFSSFVVEYASQEDAAAAFVSLVGNDRGVEAPLVGDESALTQFTGVTPDTGVDYQAARLVFRVGPMLSMIVYADLLDREPDLALLDSVAQRVAERAAVVAERESVPLSSMGLQLDPSGAEGTLLRRDLYDVRAGTLTALYAEDDATRASRIDLFTGTTDAFLSTTNGTFVLDASARQSRGADPPGQVEAAPPAPTSVISIEGESAPAAVTTPEPGVAVDPEPNTARVFVTTSLFAFPGDTEADIWFETRRDRLIAADTTSAGTFTEVPEAPSLGDAAATFATRRMIEAVDQAVGGFRMYSRVGPIVAVLDIESNADVPLDGVARLMRFQIDCIEGQGCTGLASVPQNLFG